MSIARQSKGTTLVKWLGTLFSIVLLVYLLSRQDWKLIWNALSQVPYWRFVVAFLLMLISRFAVASRWYALLRGISDKISWKMSTQMTFAGLFATNFLPTTIGGDIVRLAGAIQSDLDVAEATASLVTDRLIGMFGMVLMLPFGFVPLYGWFSNNTTPGQLSVDSRYMLGSFVFLKKLWRKVISFVVRILDSIKVWWEQPVSLLNSLLFTGIHMLCFFGIFRILFAGLNEDIPFTTIIGLYSFVYLVTLLPISINGYGLQELSISMIFSEVGGVSLQNSLTMALIFRTMTMLASLPGAFFLPGIISGNKNEFAVEESKFPLESTDK